MISTLRNCIYLIIAIMIVAGCSRSNKEIVGPEITFASDNFKIEESFTVNYYGMVPDPSGKFETVQFSRPDSIRYFNGVKTDTIAIRAPRNNYFSAKFNEKVYWTIDIKRISPVIGKDPIKTITGNSISIDSTNGAWFGNADNGYSFNEGDTLLATLIVAGKKETYSKKLYVGSSQGHNPNEAYLLNDFEGSFTQVPYGDNKDPNPNPLPAPTTSIVPPDGIRSMSIAGTDYNGDYFCGGFKVNLPKGLFIGKKASDVYVNMFVYGFGQEAGLTKNATKLGIGISEDDASTNGEFEPKFEDTFDQQISVDWVGWKLISVRYSALKRSSSVEEGGSGNNKIEPDKAFSVNCNLLSSPNGGKVATAVDYIIITYGKPYEK